MLSTMRLIRTPVLLVAILAVAVPGSSAPGLAVAARGVPTCAGEIATIVGTDDDDRLRGTDARDVIAALGGTDLVTDVGIDDVVCGGRGADRLVEDPEVEDVRRRTALFYGGAGPDRLELTFGEAHAGRGDDVVVAGAGTRQGLYGDAGDDVIRGGEGRDFPIGGAGDDRLYGGPGPDYLRGEHGGDLVIGGPGDDSAEGGPGRRDRCEAEREYGCELSASSGG